MTDHSQLMAKTLGITFPLILIFGLYMMLNGHVSPGGGFQGGAVLASVYIAKYLTEPVPDLNLNAIQTLEKGVLLLIILSATLYVTFNIVPFFTGTMVYYLMIMNLLIGIKVACGMIIIFYRFVFYESR